MNEILMVTTPVMIVIIGWFFNRMIKRVDMKMDLLDTKMDSTLNEVRATNGKLLGLETWTQGHEKLDDERFKRTEETHRDIWGKIKGLK